MAGGSAHPSTQTPIGPSVWPVSDGRAGNAAQVKAIAAALGERSRWMKLAHIKDAVHRAGPITLQPRPPWTWLPFANWPRPLLALPKAERARFTAPWPTLWLAAGRRSAPYSKAVRDWSGGKTFTVHVLDPRMDPSHFDLLVAPAHDRVSGANVISTIGSPAHFSQDALEDAAQSFAPLADERNKSVIVVLGGDSKTHTFTKSAAARLEQQLRTLAEAGWRLRITTSRRTPAPVIASMRAMADEIGAQIWSGSEDGPNPYLAWLIFSDASIVTEDSANMLSEAAWHGLPVHIARIEGRSAKFDALHKSLIERKCARWFAGTIESWSYAPLREAGRVADVIVAKLLERHPQPDMR